MKILEKFVLIIYSLLVLIISAISCLIIFRIIDINNINNCINLVLEDTSLTIIVLATSIICILLSIRCLFFRKRKQIKKSDATDILLENEAGRLLISKRAIENAVKNIVNSTMAVNPETKVITDIDPANNISIYISILIEKNVNVRDLTIGLQQKIKDRIKENFDLDIKQVNIKIDDIGKEIGRKEINKKENNKKELPEKLNNKEEQLSDKENENKIIELDHNVN